LEELMVREEFNAKEYFENLPVMTYKKILDLLADQTKQKIITFCNYIDFKTEKTYQEVRVRYFNPEKHEQYISPDQNVDDIDFNLHHVLEKSGLDVKYSICYGYVNSYIASVGINYVDFPREVAERFVKEEIEKSKQEKKNEDISRIRKPEPISDDSEEPLPFEI